MSGYNGQQGLFYQCVESDMGTAVIGSADASATGYVIEFPFDVTPNKNLIAQRGLHADQRDTHRYWPTTTSVDYVLRSHAVPADQLGWWLAAIIGADVSSQQGSTSAYRHTYTFNAMPTLRKSFTHVYSKGVEHGYTYGAMMKKLTLRGEAPVGGGPSVIMMESEWSAWTEATTLTNAPSDPTYPTIQPFVWGNTGVDIADASFTASPGINTRAWELVIDRQGVPFMGANGDGYIDKVLDGPLKLTLTLNQLVTSDFKTALKNIYQAGTLTDLQFQLEGNTIESSYKYKLLCDLDNMQLNTPPTEVMDDGVRYTDLVWEAVYDSAQMPIITLMNARTAVYTS